MRFGRMCTQGRGEMSELAEGARLEIVYTSKAYLGFESPSLRQNNERAYARYAYGAHAPHPTRRGGRVVECGGLENRFTRNPGDEGSNPSSSASQNQTPGTPGVFHFPPPCHPERTKRAEGSPRPSSARRASRSKSWRVAEILRFRPTVSTQDDTTGLPCAPTDPDYNYLRIIIITHITRYFVYPLKNYEQINVTLPASVR